MTSGYFPEAGNTNSGPQTEWQSLGPLTHLPCSEARLSKHLEKSSSQDRGIFDQEKY